MNTTKNIIILVLVVLVAPQAVFSNDALLGVKTKRVSSKRDKTWKDLEVNIKSGWHRNNKCHITYTKNGKSHEKNFGNATVDKLVYALQKIRNKGGKVSLLKIKGHGNCCVQDMGGDTTIMVSGTEVMVKLIDGRMEMITQLLKDTIADDATVYLNGCRTGEAKDSIAQEMSKILPGRTIVGNNTLVIGIPFTTKTMGDKRYFRNGELIKD